MRRRSWAISRTRSIGDLDLEEIVRQAVPVLGPMLENLGLGLKDAIRKRRRRRVCRTTRRTSSPAIPLIPKRARRCRGPARLVVGLGSIRQPGPNRSKGTTGPRPENRPRLCPVLRRLEAETVLGYLRAMTRDRTLGPRASDAALRHLEGQRGLVQHIEAMIARGRG